MTINYNENRKDLQIDKLHEDLVAELEEAKKATCDSRSKLLVTTTSLR
jgi:hypothetical protein